MPVHSGPPFEGITPWQIPVYSFDKEKAKQEAATREKETNTVKRRSSILNERKQARARV